MPSIAHGHRPALAFCTHPRSSSGSDSRLWAGIVLARNPFAQMQNRPATLRAATRVVLLIALPSSTERKPSPGAPLINPLSNAKNAVAEYFRCNSNAAMTCQRSPPPRCALCCVNPSATLKNLPRWWVVLWTVFCQFQNPSAACGLLGGIPKGHQSRAAYSFAQSRKSLRQIRLLM